MVVAAGTAASASAQWPTTCVDLNDIVEAHLGNDANVGIYQRVFGDQAEDACQDDHREDVRGVFAWAFTDSSPSNASDAVAPADIGGWPTTCVELNDIVEAHLGNDHNVAIYQRTFAAQAEPACRSDHRRDVRDVFAWAADCDARAAAYAVQTTGRAPPNTPPFALASLAQTNFGLRTAQTDFGLRNVLAAMPWLACHTYTWLADGVSTHDRHQLQQLLEVSAANEQVGMLVADSAWFGDWMDYQDPYSSRDLALRSLRDLSAKSPNLRNAILSYSWISDDMSEAESYALIQLLAISDQDLPLAIRLANTKWIKDSILPYESYGLSRIALMLRNPPEGARELIEYTLQDPLFTSDLDFLEELYGIRFGASDRGPSDSEAYDILRSQPWFADGLNAEERAFISAIGLGSKYNPGFADMVRTYYAHSSTISLPLTGTVRLWVFHHEPFDEGKNLLGMAAQGVLGAERIMGTALLTNDVVVYLGGYYGGVDPPNRVVLPTPSHRPVMLTRDLIFESIAELYFDHRIGPFYPSVDSLPEGAPILFETRWLETSGPEFVRAYVNDWLGFKSIVIQNHEWVEETRINCKDRGLESIYMISRQVAPFDVAIGEEYRECTEAYGRNLLVRLFLTIGEKRMSAALGELHHIANYYDARLDDEGIRIPSEKDVFRVFIKHTPLHLQDEVRHWYRQLQGAPFIDEAR